MSSALFPVTPLTEPNRHAERVNFEVDQAYAILDEAIVCHAGTSVDGVPLVLPMLHVRVGDSLFLHGATASTLMRRLREGPQPLCATVTLLDGLVLAASHFSHSVNYRCVVARGEAELVRDPVRKRQVLGALVDHILAGRAADSRSPAPKELAATAVLELPLRQVSVKVRTGPPGAAESAEEEGYWRGVVPLHTLAGPPLAETHGPLPGYLDPHPVRLARRI